MVDNTQLWKTEDVLRRCNFSRSALYRAMKDRGFPPPKRFSSRCLRFEANKVEEWIKNRPLAAPKAKEPITT